MLDTLSNLLAVLLALSVASERLVEILKNIFPWLRTARPTAPAEARRRLALQGLAVLAGILTAFLAESILPAAVLAPPAADHPARYYWHLAVLGLLASGGSGFWTSVLGYVNNVKTIKKTQALAARVQAAATVAAIAHGTAGPAAAQPGFREAAAAVGPAHPLAGAAAATKNLEKAIALANAQL